MDTGEIHLQNGDGRSMNKMDDNIVVSRDSQLITSIGVGGDI